MSSAETIILRELLASENGYVSGNALAERLGVSRVAVWSQMEKLRAAGFEFEARPRHGYRLAATPARLEPVFLEALLPPEWQHVPIHFHEEIDSTNSEAERQLASGLPSPFVVIARAQTRGRGRLGRPWYSGDSGNLYLSFVFQPRLPPARMQAFTLWMGASICHLLNLQVNVPVQVKWPNDLVLAGKKLGGMLTEARVDNDQIRDLVFGFGLNVNGRPDQWPEDLRAIATSLAEASGSALCLNRFSAHLVAEVLAAYQRFVSADVRPDLQQLWARYDFLAGQPVTARLRQHEISGTARGIDPDGGLILESYDGSRQLVSAGDVTLAKPVSP
jgi:BirA family transcriptional regulator, biotin operon repressor / biotin---[acetyl-CoA-carboxylase] ligase